MTAEWIRLDAEVTHAIHHAMANELSMSHTHRLRKSEWAKAQRTAAWDEAKQLMEKLAYLEQRIAAQSISPWLR